MSVINRISSSIVVRVDLEGDERFKAVDIYGHQRRHVLIESVTVTVSASSTGGSPKALFTGKGRRYNGDGTVGRLSAANVALRVSAISPQVRSLLREGFQIGHGMLPLDLMAVLDV